MNIDDLTIGEAKRLAAMFGAPVTTAPAYSDKPERAVVICTDKRGVFFGYTAETGETMTLRKARMCVYWPSEQRGVLGLASDGPKKGAKISPATDGTFMGVTCVLECTEAAVKAWEAAPWAS